MCTDCVGSSTLKRSNAWNGLMVVSLHVQQHDGIALTVCAFETSPNAHHSLSAAITAVDTTTTLSSGR